MPARRDQPMTKDEMRAWLHTAGLTIAAGAVVLGIAKSTLQRYLLGAPIPPCIAKLTRAMIALGRTDV